MPRPHADAGGVGPAPDEDLWSAVGEPSRRRLLDLLLAEGEATPTVLAAQVSFSRQAVTKHLAVLERAGLVTARREGREVRYRVDAARLDAATREMARVARDWDRRLDTLKSVAEAAHRAETRGPGPEQPRSG